MSPEAIAAFLTSLTGLVGVLTGVVAAVSSRARKADRALRKRMRRMEKWIVKSQEHMFFLESDLAAAGLPVRPRPPLLDEIEDDEDDEPEPSAKPVAKESP